MKEKLLKYFPNLSETQIAQYLMLFNIFPEWNLKLNLISRKDIDNLFEHHILHSLSIGKIFQFDPGTRIIDIGTGGGFPGMPLAIMFPEVEFDLVDSINKKIVAVSEIAKELNLKNVKAITSRAELLPASYDFITSRAVTSLPNFVKISRKLFQKSENNKMQGIIYLKGGSFEDELKEFQGAQLYNIEDFFEEDFFETKKIIYLNKKVIKNF